MERMIKRIAVRKDGTISMSEFRNFAEKYQGEIDKLEKENRKLKEENEKLKYENISLHIELEEIKDDGELSYEEKLLYE